MNHTYRLVWNRKLRVWQAASELAAQARGGRSSSGGRVSARAPRYALSVALAMGLSSLSAAVQATCSLVGSNAVCTGAANPLFPGYALAIDGTVTVQQGATVGVIPGAGGTAMNLTGSTVTLTNSGWIDPTILGPSSVVAAGVAIGNGSVNTLSIVNTATGTIGGLVGGEPSLPDLSSMAIAVHNGAGGTTRLSNAGLIRSSPRTGLIVAGADMPVIAAYGGGQVMFENLSSGTIIGRIALEEVGTPGLGHSFANAGLILGGVSLGQGGNNTFTAVSGSSVLRASGNATADLPVSTEPGLNFAPPGTVDGGAGANNTLVLQSVLPSAGTGAGTPGAATTISGDQYINFDNLVVNSGTWDLTGSTLADSAVTFNSGVANIAKNNVLGSAQITANGGTITGPASGLLLDNDFVLGAGGLTLAGNNDILLDGTISGTGGLTIAGPAVVVMNGANTYAGLTTIQSGSALDTGTQSVRGDVLNNGYLMFRQDTNGTYAGDISGTGGLGKAGTGTVTLTGANAAGTSVSITAGTLAIGAGGSLSAPAISLSMGSTLDLSAAGNQTLGALQDNGAVQLGASTLTLDSNASYNFSGTISGAGSLIKTGAGTQTLSGANTFGGSVAVSGGTLALGVGGSLLPTAGVTVNAGGTLDLSAGGNRGLGLLSGAGTVALGANTLTLQTGNFAGTLSGTGGLDKAGPGSLTLSGTNTYTGLTRVLTGGTLIANGTIAGSVAVQANSTLGGSGRINQNVTLTSGVLRATQGQTLTIGGNLLMDSASRVNVSLGAASNGALVRVDGDLGLHGTLNVADQGGFGAGVYRLFDYAGALTGNTMSVGATPSGIDASDLRLQTAVGGQVNLLSTAGATLSFWDGANAAQRDNGLIDGGTGAWRADGLNWTDGDGALNGRFQPNPTFAVFQGAGGTVTVDDTAGAIGVTGMQIATDGYRIEGDAIALQGAGGKSIIRVGTGMAASAGMRGTIASSLSGASTLVKSDFGTLVLAGNNTYTGGTEVRQGTLSVSADANLGATAGAVTLNGGTLATTASFDSARAVSLLQDGVIDVDAGTTLGLQGNISGAADLQKQGAGTLKLSGVNSYGNTRVEAGTLAGNASAIRGNLLNNGTVVFEEAAGAAYAGQLTGTGSLVKTGAGQLQLLGDSQAFAGQTQVQAGTLRVADALGGSASVTGGRLQVDGLLRGNVAASGTGVIAGAGTITGNAALTGGVLEGAQGQMLTIAGDLSLTSASQVNVALGSAPSGSLFSVGGDLTLAGTLNVADQGGFGAGVYRLFDYAGSLTNNNLVIGSAPAGADVDALTVQTSVAGQVNLASTSGAALGFWDGGNAALHDNAAVDGGGGTWRADNLNWTSVDGTLNGVFKPNPTYAVFQGQAGTVTVDDAAGAIRVSGIQIAADGYRIQGDSISLQGAGGISVIRVGTGSIADAGMTGTIASSLTGHSTLSKFDFGTLVLSGDNTYIGGTDIRQGTLSVSRDANLGAASGSLMLSGGVLATTASFDTARAVKVNAASGLAVSAGSTLGLGGAITGNGELTKSGAGTLRVFGNGSAYTGNLLVEAGTLDIASAATLGGSLAVSSGAQLQGAGQVGSTTLRSGAILAPGNLGGVLTVAGDLTLLPGSTYQVAADPASSASARVAVTGAANLAGSVVHIGPEGGFDSTRQYTILTAGAINGQFDTVSSNYAYLSPTLQYAAQNVTLQLERKQAPVNPVDPATPPRPIAFADAAQSSNQRAVANALDTLPAGNPLHEYVLTLPEGAPPAVFNSLSGEAHASVASSLMGASAAPRALPLSHLRANLNAGMRAGAPTAQAGGTFLASALPSSNAQPAWAEVVGNWQTLQGDANTAQVRQHTGGVFAGADHAVGNGWRLGGALGYTDSKIRVDGRASQSDVSGYSASVYGGKSFAAGAGKLNLLAGAAYTWHDVSTERHASVSGVQQKLTADYGASTAQLFTELGYAMPLSERASIEPFAGIAWSDLRTRSFSESGGSAALHGQSSSDKQTTSTLGLRAQTAFMLGRAEGRLHGTLGWRHAFGDVAPQSTLAFDGGQAFTVSGTPIARNAALAELGAEVAMSANATLGLFYSGQYGGGNREHSGSLNVRWRY
ncbi:autotransporter domain-containing protein [Achromobacter sp. NFACC18-2]|uniref:autotransporter domain-containing protein n=1 Tax=Achromobacter sp. NFACC18-2 TaxID=1564112 RepID=UPI0008B019EB|nr:autotransporter domain-containing protein [Achromobacter sp. NFACC18-2]SEK11803.1 outer membrane autotransporter barrel domain-containing protein [Achromobacter sp. NFACC18-2]